jgi:nucleoid-associated protein YgaU
MPTGSDVALKFAGVEVGRATAGADGSFAIVPEKPLPVGAGDLTLETTVGGTVLSSADQIAVVVNRDQKPAVVARVEASAPTQLVQPPAAQAGAPAKEVQLSAVDYDADGNIVFQGRVSPGGTVRFYVDNQLAGDVTSDPAGNWLFKGSSPIAAGTHTLRADEIDATGKVISRAELPFLREEAEKVLASASETGGAPAAAQQVESGQTSGEQPDQVQPKSPGTETQVASADTTAQPEAPPVIAATPNGPPRIVIQPGNNLWRISRQVYGKGRLFTVIWEANRDQIKNPNRIYPGQILSAPKS